MEEQDGNMGEEGMIDEGMTDEGMEERNENTRGQETDVITKTTNYLQNINNFIELEQCTHNTEDYNVYT